MDKGILGMSAEERSRAHVIRLVVERRLRQVEAAERLGISVRHVKRLVRAWRSRGDEGLISRQRGRVSPRRMQAETRAKIEALLREKYADLGATFAAEKLAEIEKISVSHETIRQIQMEIGLWKPKSRKEKRIHQPRERRPRFGELIQIDGSPPYCVNFVLRLQPKVYARHGRRPAVKRPHRRHAPREALDHQRGERH